MNIRGIQLTHTGSRFVAAAILAATVACAPGLALAADKDAHVDRTEQRVGEMHDKLKITTAQEEMWAKVAQAMADNAKAMDTLTQARKDRAGAMTAVDDLKSYGEIADAHAEGIRKLTPAFATLYASMSDAQKAEADTLFRHGKRMHGEGKRGHKPAAKAPESK